MKVLTNGYISPAEPWLVLIMMALDHPHLIKTLIALTLNEHQNGFPQMQSLWMLHLAELA